LSIVFPWLAGAQISIGVVILFPKLMAAIPTVKLAD
jgi:hypothetical protein